MLGNLKLGQRAVGRYLQQRTPLKSGSNCPAKLTSIPCTCAIQSLNLKMTDARNKSKPLWGDTTQERRTTLLDQVTLNALRGENRYMRECVSVDFCDTFKV
eukprot:1875033-Amphidinium_carterae.2